MAKKTPTGTNKPTQQRSKEEQWRRRVAAQTRATTPTLSDNVDGGTTTAEDIDGYTQAEMRQMPKVSTGTSAPARAGTAPASANVSRTGTPSAAAAAAQRRAMANRTTRTRIGANVMSLEEEMQYVRSDVRALIILTAICLAVIIALAFVIR